MNKKKIFIILSSFCICLAMLFVIGNKQQIKELFNMDSVIVNEGESNKIKLAKYSTDGSSLTVVASIDPDVSNRTVSWSLAWNGTGTGNVTDYVTISNSADTLTCTITFKKGFTTQIKLTCTSNSNSSVKAYATIDYVGRDFDTTFTVSGAVLGTDETSGQLFKTKTVVDYMNLTYYKKNDTTSKGGTISGEVRFYEPSSAGNITVHLNRSGLKFNFNIGDLSSSDLYSSVHQYALNNNKTLSSVLQSIMTDGVIGFELPYSIQYNGKEFASGTKTIFYNFDWNQLEVFANNVTLDDSSIIF